MDSNASCDFSTSSASATQSNRGSLRTRFLFGHAVCERPWHLWNFRNPATIIFKFCFNVKLQILAPNSAWRFSLGGHIK
jgi:hypothetical protein